MNHIWVCPKCGTRTGNDYNRCAICGYFNLDIESGKFSRFFKDRFSREIFNFYHKTIGDLQKGVSLSRKGRPRRQAWGMHIER